MQLAAKHFKASSSKALLDAQLQKALGNVEKGFIGKRQKAADALPEFDALRDNARDIKNHVLAHLDLYLEEYERNVVAAGGHVHWAETAEDARRIVLEICQKANARTVTKGKSMITEEIALNDHLAANGIELRNATAPAMMQGRLVKVAHKIDQSEMNCREASSARGMRRRFKR